MPPLEPEWKTRKERIDKRLTAFASAWKIIPFRADLNPADLDGCAVEEFPTDHGPADYALFVRGQFLGVIEGKRVGVNPQNALEQAKRYSRGATMHGSGNWNGFRVPFLFATNGEIIWFTDVRRDQPVSRPLAQFHTPAALAELFALDSQRSHA